MSEMDEIEVQIAKSCLARGTSLFPWLRYVIDRALAIAKAEWEKHYAECVAKSSV